MTHKSDVTDRRYAEQGERLRAARETAGLSRPDVASHVVPGAVRGRQTVYEWEAGVATPSVAQLAQLCRLYGVSADNLLGLPEPNDAIRLQVVGRVAGGDVVGARELLDRLVPRVELLDHDAAVTEALGDADERSGQERRRLVSGSRNQRKR